MTTNMIIRASEIFGAALAAGLGFACGASMWATAIYRLNAWLTRRQQQRLARRYPVLPSEIERLRAQLAAALKREDEARLKLGAIEQHYEAAARFINLVRERVGVATGQDMFLAIDELRSRPEFPVNGRPVAVMDVAATGN